jgi:hypothetical protein
MSRDDYTLWQPWSEIILKYLYNYLYFQKNINIEEFFNFDPKKIHFFFIEVWLRHICVITNNLSGTKFGGIRLKLQRNTYLCCIYYLPFFWGRFAGF